MSSLSSKSQKISQRLVRSVNLSLSSSDPIRHRGWLRSAELLRFAAGLRSSSLPSTDPVDVVVKVPFDVVALGGARTTGAGLSGVVAEHGLNPSRYVVYGQICQLCCIP